MKTEDLLLIGGAGLIAWTLISPKNVGSALFNVPADLISGFGSAYQQRWTSNYQAVTAAPQPQVQQFRQIQSNFFPYNVMTLFGMRWF